MLFPLLAILCGGTLVYGLAFSGWVGWGYQATALVRQRQLPSPGDSKTAGATALSPARVADDLLSEANLRRAWERLNDAAQAPPEADGRPLDPLRRNLAVSLQELPGGQWQLAVSGRQSTPAAAVRLVNLVVEQYTQQFTESAAQQHSQQYAAAQAAAAEARASYLRASQALSGFLDEHFAKHQARAEQLRAGQGAAGSFPPAAAAATAASVPAQPPTTVNPQWLKLDKRRAEAQRALDRLLVERTSVHPEVQEALRRLDECRTLLAQTPRRIPVPSGAPVNETPPAAGYPKDGPELAAAPRFSGPAVTGTAGATAPVPAANPGFETARVHQSAVGEFRVRKSECVEAERLYDQRSKAEQRERDAQLCPPPIQVEFARQATPVNPLVEILPAAARPHVPALFAALLAFLGGAVVMAFFCATPTDRAEFSGVVQVRRRSSLPGRRGQVA
jgi:hypothetical protein